MAKRRSAAKAKRVQQVRRQKIVICCLAVFVVVLVGIYRLNVAEEKTVKADVAVEEKESVKDKTLKKHVQKDIEEKVETEKERLDRVEKEARQKGYPEDVIKLLSKNPETVEFVEKYGELKDSVPAAEIEEFTEGQIPLLLQWDDRWGYSQYGTSNIAVCGCGPTCLSMVFSYLTGDKTLTPDKMAEYGMEHDYINEQNDTRWLFMAEAGEDWGIDCREEILDEKQLIKEIEAGHPVICSVGPGDFTDKGHFIVLTDVENGKIVVHDSFSKKNSEKRWEYGEFKDQIKVMWIYSKK